MRRKRQCPHLPTAGFVMLDARLTPNSLLDLLAELKTDWQFAVISVILFAVSELNSDLFCNCAQVTDGLVQKQNNLVKLIRETTFGDTLPVLLAHRIPAI